MQLTSVRPPTSSNLKTGKLCIYILSELLPKLCCSRRAGAERRLCCPPKGRLLNCRSVALLLLEINPDLPFDLPTNLLVDSTKKLVGLKNANQPIY